MNPPFTVLRVHSLNCITIVVLTNLYHHPHKDVIQRLNDYDIHIYRSDETGMVSIVYYGKDNYIYQ